MPEAPLAGTLANTMHGQSKRRRKGRSGAQTGLQRPSQDPGCNCKCNKGGKVWGGFFRNLPQSRCWVVKSTATPSPSCSVSVGPAPSFLGQSSPGAHQGACGPDGDTVVTRGKVVDQSRLSKAQPCSCLARRRPRSCSSSLGHLHSLGSAPPRMGRSEAHGDSLRPPQPVCSKRRQKIRRWGGVRRTFRVSAVRTFAPGRT